MSAERLLKTVHGWLGVLILPWVIIAGLTGIYMNHSKLVLSVLPAAQPVAELLDGQPQVAATAEQIRGLSLSLLGPQSGDIISTKFNGRPVFKATSGQRQLRMDKATGAYWVSGPILQVLYAASGERLETSVRWSHLLNQLHRRGWASEMLGTWPADLTAGALTFFGFSGLYLFLAPRFRRRRNRRARGGIVNRV